MLSQLIGFLKRLLARLGPGQANGGGSVDEPREPVTGIFEPGAGMKDIPPMDGFSKAIENGVELIANEWGPGTFNVSVKLEATVNVKNPGQIDSYRAVMG
jgi:hypothetical protein